MYLYVKLQVGTGKDLNILISLVTWSLWLAFFIPSLDFLGKLYFGNIAGCNCRRLWNWPRESTLLFSWSSLLDKSVNLSLSFFSRWETDFSRFSHFSVNEVQICGSFMTSMTISVELGIGLSFIATNITHQTHWHLVWCHELHRSLWRAPSLSETWHQYLIGIPLLYRQ